MCIDCIDMIRFLFFSSRRRHTRCALVTGVQTCALPICKAPRLVVPDEALASDMRWIVSAVSALSRALIDNWIERVLRSMLMLMEIGRASGRERVCKSVSIPVVAVAIKKTIAQLAYCSITIPDDIT